MLVFILPLLAALIAVPLVRWNSAGVWSVFYVLTAAGYWIVYRLLLTPSLRYNLTDGTSVLLEHLSEQWGIGLVALFPSYIEPSPVSVIWGIAAPVVVVAAGLVAPPRCAAHCHSPPAARYTAARRRGSVLGGGRFGWTVG